LFCFHGSFSGFVSMVHLQGLLPSFFQAILGAWLAWDAGRLGWCKKRANWHAF
jgi:hypothetical protein